MFYPPTDSQSGPRFDPLGMAGPVSPQMQTAYMWQRPRTPEQLLFDNRIIFIGSSPDYADPRISDYLANITIQKLLWLATEKKSADIHIYINSPGGSISAGLAIYDAMQFIDCPINTYCMGIAASMAAVLLAAGTKGKRFALPNSKVMCHQPYGQVGGQVSDIEIQAKEILKERDRMNQILAKHTGRSIEEVAKQTDRDYYLSPEEAKAFGLVDEVLIKPKDAKK
jgi:ATP-dependent Clp protease protease subunit